MTLKEQIEKDVVAAMKNKERRLSILRMLRAALQNAAIEKRAKVKELKAELDEKETLDIVRRQVKQLKESLQDFQKGNRADLADKAKEELEEKKDQTEQRKRAYEDLQKELENKKQDLAEQADYKQTLLVKTQSSELQYKTLLNNLRSQYQQIENEITGIEQEVRRKLADQDRFSGITDDEAVLSWPTQSRYITAYFYDKEYPYRYVFEHNAIDVRASQGSPVYAAASGYVGRAKRCTSSSCYSFIMIIHSGGVSTVYGHLSRIDVTEEQFVTRGQIIGYSGGTPGTIGAGPFVTGPHIHFETRVNGIPVNPLDYLLDL